MPGHPIIMPISDLMKLQLAVWQVAELESKPRFVTLKFRFFLHYIIQFYIVSLQPPKMWINLSLDKNYRNCKTNKKPNKQQQQKSKHTLS